VTIKIVVTLVTKKRIVNRKPVVSLVTRVPKEAQPTLLKLTAASILRIKIIIIISRWPNICVIFVQFQLNLKLFGDTSENF
jgi:hypothetical protein